MMTKWKLVAALVVLVLGNQAIAAKRLPDDPLERRCWLQHTAERTSLSLFAESTPVTFSNLGDGYQVRTPFWVEFGISGMGVIPAGTKRDKAGHHHLLIDTPLPASITEQPIPFSDKYRHFGKAQTATALDLPAGPHTLRLLFADYEHRPYFVFSRKITVNVVGNRKDTPKPKIDPEKFNETCQSWYQDEVSTPPGDAKLVYVKNIRDGESVDSPFLVKLGVVGFGVAPEGTSIPATGHFVLNVKKNKPPASSVRLREGQTETILDLAPGDYDIDLSFVSGDGQVLLQDQLKVTVVKQVQAPRK